MPPPRELVNEEAGGQLFSSAGPRVPGVAAACSRASLLPLAGKTCVCMYTQVLQRSVSSPGFCLGTALDLSSVLHSQLAEEHICSLGGVRHLYKQDCRMMLVHRLGWVTSGYLWLAKLHRFQFRHRGVLPAWAASGPGFCLGVKEHCTLLPFDRENKTFS